MGGAAQRGLPEGSPPGTLPPRGAYGVGGASAPGAGGIGRRLLSDGGGGQPGRGRAVPPPAPRPPAAERPAAAGRPAGAGAGLLAPCSARSPGSRAVPPPWAAGQPRSAACCCRFSSCPPRGRPAGGQRCPPGSWSRRRRSRRSTGTPAKPVGELGRDGAGRGWSGRWLRRRAQLAGTPFWCPRSSLRRSQRSRTG